MADDAPIWFITGCSSGFGEEVAKQVIARGWRAVATARDAGAIAHLAEEAADRVLLQALDVSKPEQIEAAVEAARVRFGRIDVLVNNAGYGYMASAEEGEDARIRALFEVNVFGLFALTRAVLPMMRDRRSGHILNISSVAGLVGFLGSGYYTATKHAVEGFSKALAQELRPIGIRVTCVEPGPFRTKFAGDALQRTPSRIEDYAGSIGKRMAQTQSAGGQQPGDPARAAAAMIAVTQEAEPPQHLVLGKPGYETIVAHLREQLAEIEARRGTSLAADFPED